MRGMLLATIVLILTPAILMGAAILWHLRAQQREDQL